MTIITIILFIDIVASIALIFWLVRRYYRRFKESPAEKALKQQLLELQKNKKNNKDMQK
jgi:uncharacterized protein YpmB